MLTRVQILHLESRYSNSEFNTKGAVLWKNSYIWNVKETAKINGKKYTVAFDHGYGLVALFEGDNLIAVSGSGLIHYKNIIVSKHHHPEEGWIYLCAKSNEDVEVSVFDFAC